MVSLFCPLVLYSCDHLVIMFSLPFPDSAGINSNFPLHLLLQKAPGLQTAPPPIFLSFFLSVSFLPPFSPSPPNSSGVSCHLVLFSHGSFNMVTYDLPELFLHSSKKMWPTFGWCQFSSLRLFLLPWGPTGYYSSVSTPPLFMAQLQLAWLL